MDGEVRGTAFRPAHVAAGRSASRSSRLSCPGCRLAYFGAALARLPALMAGAACPRCGARLEADGAAVRSSLSGQRGNTQAPRLPGAFELEKGD